MTASLIFCFPPLHRFLPAVFWPFPADPASRSDGYALVGPCPLLPRVCGLGNVSKFCYSVSRQTQGMTRMSRIAVLDDWQGIAETATDWSALKSRAEVVFF